jgi:DHA1 family bicyclomycin/chloramphenicol resistance-like MFS transporter
VTSVKGMKEIMERVTAGMGPAGSRMGGASALVDDDGMKEQMAQRLGSIPAGGIAVASLLNARLVERLGSRLISHYALLGFIGFSALHATVAISGHETIWTFAVLQALTMFCFGLIAGNFGSMAMEPMGHIAGTASSAQGFISTTVGASLGFLIGQQFNGSTVPMTVGFVLLGLTALVFVLVAERGQLFRARNLPPVPAPS